jgi:hypothetical protein
MVVAENAWSGCRVPILGLLLGTKQPKIFVLL